MPFHSARRSAWRLAFRSRSALLCRSHSAFVMPLLAILSALAVLRCAVGCSLYLLALLRSALTMHSPSRCDPRRFRPWRCPFWARHVLGASVPTWHLALPSFALPSSGNARPHPQHPDRQTAGSKGFVTRNCGRTGTSLGPPAGPSPRRRRPARLPCACLKPGEAHGRCAWGRNYFKGQKGPTPCVNYKTGKTHGSRYLGSYFGVRVAKFEFFVFEKSFTCKRCGCI